jgi:acid phosphatase family membrane protein YuiD
MRACSFIFVLNSFPVVVQVMYDASGVRLQAGRQAEVCTSTLLSYHTILSLLTSAASIRDLTVLIDHFMLCGRFCSIY